VTYNSGMTRTDGQYFSAALKALGLDTDQEKAAKSNAENIVRKVIEAYEHHIAPAHVGSESKGIPSGFSPSTHLHALTGLVYGRIQSGKTRAMIGSTAMAFDNGFRIVVVLTSNINDLVTQTHFDFSSGLPNVMVYTKDNELDEEIGNAKIFLEAGDGRMLIVCSKGAPSLTNVIAFLRKVQAKLYPAIIFDDEGDQASLDTNTRKRSLSPVAVAPSSINKLIQEKLRPTIPCHIYVSVTGTPQAVLLQSAESRNRPSFITLLPPGESYIGGKYFFGTDEPEQNSQHLIRTVERDEKDKLLAPSTPIPRGLRCAILFFLLSSAALIKKNGGVPAHGKGYSFLCHPSLKNMEQSLARERITNFLEAVTTTLLKMQGANEQVWNELRQEYEDLKATLGDKAPPLEELSKTIIAYLRTRRILVINAKTKRQGIAYGPELNFLIGGNTLGRGIAIRDLLVTYYIRDSKISQIDTMHQHARMFGYRKDTLSFTRLFIPRHLYYRFRDIHQSDEDLREYIEQYKDTPETFPIEFTFDLRTTRPGVLDVNKTDTLQPGKQVFPNYVIAPQDSKAYSKVEQQLSAHFGAPGPLMEGKGKVGAKISVAQAIRLVKPIKTKSENTWRDKTICAVIERVAGEFGNQINLKFRKAERAVGEGGFISTGTLSGTEYENAKNDAIPTLWIMAVESADGSSCGKGKRFMYPTFVIPNTLPKMLIFNKG
jgi:hypothetical protein